MLTITITRTGRTWYGRPTYTAAISDSTGNIAFHGYSRKEAEMLAKSMPALIGDGPVGSVARNLARNLAGRTPAPGEEWTVRF